MTKLDFRLQRLLGDWSGETRVHILVQYQGDLSGLEEVGFQVTSVAGDVAAGSISVDDIERLAQHEGAIRVGGVRFLKDEMDVSTVAVNLVDPATHVRKVPGLGRGAIIGLIDSGFELTHPAFRDANGKTRVLAAWDQVDLSELGTLPPAKYGYGIEYSQQAIDSSIANNQIVTIKNHPLAGPHGTYVAGIAAGNGDSNAVYSGIAPEASLVLVAYRNNVPVGGSAFFLDAIDYIIKVADQQGKRAVINVSQGDNLGAHDGTSLLEIAIDNLISQGRTLIVTSAGNERGVGVGHHTAGQVNLGQETVVPFTLMVDESHQVNDDTMELWYDGTDRFAVALKPPNGKASSFVEAGASSVIEFPDGNAAHIYSEVSQLTRKDNRVGIILNESNGWPAGKWELILRGDTVHNGHFDIWSDRPNAVTVIGFEGNRSDDCTVTLPGNARLAITVGGFVSRPKQQPGTAEVTGQVFLPSSIGPTRDGRVKPDLAAPASLIMAPRIRTVQNPVSYDPTAGTSMAAPHVTGIIALLWALWPRLGPEQIRTALIATASKDQFTGSTRNQTWGAGKVDAEQAYRALSNLFKMGETSMDNLTVFEFQMNPQPRPEPNAGSAGMAIRIAVENGERIIVTGVSDGQKYEGLLLLRKKGSQAAEWVSTNNLEASNAADDNNAAPGGDECWIDGRWYNPCPVAGSGPPQ